MEQRKMNECPDCCVLVDGSLKNCPLCGRKLTDEPSGDTMYPDIQKEQYISRRSLLTDELLTLTIIGIGICALINILTWNGMPWFLAVAAGVLFSWVLVKGVVLSELYPGLKALCAMASFFGLMFALDYMTGFYGWSYEALLPLILLAGIVYIDFFSFFHKSYWRDNLVYAILFLILGFIPLIFYLAGITHAFLPMLLCAIGSVLTILGIIRFTIRHLKSELKKRLHM
ncbi:MAG: DUF6320 domain-containing protein [Christensenellaceae bacterium]|jgi:hypothetical protein